MRWIKRLPRRFLGAPSPRTGLVFPGPAQQVAAGQLQVPLVPGEDPEAVVPGAEAQGVELLQLQTANGKRAAVKELKLKLACVCVKRISPDLELLLSSGWVPLVALEGHVGLFDGHAVHRLHDLERAR